MTILVLSLSIKDLKKAQGGAQKKALVLFSSKLGWICCQSSTGIPLVLLFLIAKVCVWSKRILGKRALLKWFFAEVPREVKRL